MSDIAISAEAVGKKYTIGHTSNRPYGALRDVIAENSKLVWDRIAATVRGRPLPAGHNTEEVWALEDVSFQVKRGEVLGVIGLNGAGKSTLLKILSRITEPSIGRIMIAGRVASLLEVGTGFHPELTGRENIYLNGAILGMYRSEIRAKFDEIVAFAGIEKYIDTPVKRYSSGMYVRLAFSVAAHLEPEILLVDEVLAVGDVGFQQKCLGKMGETARSGRTILYVSHNMPSVQALCSHCLVLDKGRIACCAEPAEAINYYMSKFRSAIDSSGDLTQRKHNGGSGEARFIRIELLDDSDNRITSLLMGEALTVHVELQAKELIHNPSFAIHICDQYGSTVLRAYSYESHAAAMAPLDGHNWVRCRFDTLPLLSGRYSIYVWVGYAGHALDIVDGAAAIEIEPNDVFATGRVPGMGVLYAPHQWQQGDADTCTAPTIDNQKKIRDRGGIGG